MNNMYISSRHHTSSYNIMSVSETACLIKVTELVVILIVSITLLLSVTSVCN